MKPKEDRLNLRASSRQTSLIREAADTVGKTMTDFVLDSACSKAEEVLADRRHFVLDDDAWARFMEALDRPARAKPRLKELLETPSVLDRS
ncbi:MAG: DUF1778 domain-containing protein [Rhodospirillales bacterium]|nr:DUF1778 domain-containing protein [Rhodospirillales bacterium]